MAQNENYSQVDLRVGTEEQFNAKVGTLPAGTLFGVTDSTVSKADLSTDLKNEINGKINKPANPTSDSAITINSSGTISTKPLSSITGKTEVAVQSTTPTGDEILWINPNGTSGRGGSSGGGKLYRHDIIYRISSQSVTPAPYIGHVITNSLTNTEEYVISLIKSLKGIPAVYYYYNGGGEEGHVASLTYNEPNSCIVLNGYTNYPSSGTTVTFDSDTVTEL